MDRLLATEELFPRKSGPAVLPDLSVRNFPPNFQKKDCFDRSCQTGFARQDAFVARWYGGTNFTS